MLQPIKIPEKKDEKKPMFNEVEQRFVDVLKLKKKYNLPLTDEEAKLIR